VPARHKGPRRLTSGLAAALTGLALATVPMLGLTGAAPASAATAPRSTESGPAGHAPYGVGRETLNLVDDSRGTPANGSAPALSSRTLSTWVLYPAVGAPTAQPVANAQPASDGKPFPVIVFAHGLDSLGLAYDPLLQQWVERGFVVVAPTFPLSNIAAPGGDTAKDLVNQPGDMSFVLSQVLALSKQSGNPLSGMIDPRRIAAVGHSLGAMTVLAWTENTCCLDPRVDAAVIVDGTETPFGKGRFFAGHRTTPILVLHGTSDRTIPYAQGRKIYEDAKTPKFLVSLIGAPHVSFLQLGPPNQKPPRWEKVDVNSVIDFLDGELNHDNAALHNLAVVGNTKGIARFQEQLGP
jgi:predicted dienelactone hydrolase